MKPGLYHRPDAPVEKKRLKSGVTKYLFSFVLMLIFTAIAFYLVAFPKFDTQTTFWIILIAAIIQAVLQLFTFMHLDQKGYGTVIVIMIFAIVIASVSAVGIVLM
ncbi:cytochrome C oxidase subunit IV family protein [Thermoflavimicrobium dichotomicum]|uniref:Cytochrome c oxidase subunit 4 n=1 Tax=Thermoflavimicrobium dichotomicum TaxID=46223 RepID=A0A1I3K531_9BACL|nr:cytochrome C oxidase subunit IV family protein [Thermoflavimicrobium dichotomicum]SFI67621.1 cytochrome c oxidase subunit 4 [Thermoflavimicrobium dichotomicum]